MGIFRNAWTWLTMSADGVPDLHQFDAQESPPQPVDVMIGAMLHGTGRVGRTEALSVPAVLRGRNLICGSISTLPLRQLDADNRVVRLPLLEQIDPDVPNSVTLAQTLEDLLFEGGSWWRVTAFGADGYPSSARHLLHASVSLQPPGGRTPAPLPGGYDPRNAVIYADGEPIPASQVIRFDSPNPPLLVAAGRAIRRAIALDAAAEVYTESPRPLDYFSPADMADPADDDDVQDILDNWAASRRRRSTAYVPAALKYNSVDTPTPADLQLVELQKRAALDLANAMGLDPEDLGVSTTSRTYQNATDRRQDRVNDVLSPYMRAVTDRLSMGDVTKRGYRVAFDLDDYLKADAKTRAEVQAIYLDKGVIDVDEVRDEEDLPPLPAGARAAVSGPVPGQPANVVPFRPRAVAAGADHDLLTFDGDVDRALTLNFEPTQFGVDFEARTIEGIVVPYGRDKIALKNGRRWRFKPGALQYGETRRVKLLRDHDFAQPLGRLEYVEERPEGTFARYKVGRGPDGDRALAEAEDGVRDGFSVGVDITEFEPDPENPGVFLATRAVWRETSVLAVPAFPDAMVSRVAASADQGDSMDPCTTCGQHHAPGVACTASTTLAAAAPGGFDVNAFAAAFAALQQGGTLAQTNPEPRPVVNPTRATAFVAEAAPYRFDGSGNLRRGSHEFSTDIFAMLRGDHTAGARVNDFVREQFDVVGSNVDELNPTRQRPDMYVDQRDFRYPLWDAIRKGTLSDVTPFTFPKFNSAGSLVANHTEGNEPGSGTFVTTSATVTPTPVSGKIKISRETVDQGGNPQVTGLIWRQMTKAWYEALEAFAVTTLDAASPTQIDFSASPGLANDDLDQAITAAFADLQFVRGGFSMDNLFTQVDLYKALVAAVGQDGRRLYPALGPTNANGTVRARYAALDINGVVALPAWALAATGTVAASSYLFDSDSVWGWASNPNRIDITQTEVANVYIGLWGYKAAVITDINGVRELIYDPQ